MKERGDEETRNEALGQRCDLGGRCGEIRRPIINY